MLEPLNVWKETFARVSPSANESWARALSSWADERSTGKLQLATVMGSVQFTFQKGIFLSELQRLAPVSNAQQGALGFANAWEKALMSSQLLVLPGSFLGAPTPATTWSVVTSLIDASSVAAGKAHLVSRLTAAPPVAETPNAIFADAFHGAFFLLTATVTGMNCLPIPTPLLSPVTPAA